MGWTSYHATYYKKGKIDRKAECDAYWLEGLNRGHFNVLKSSMVGNVYYAAIEPLKKYAGKDKEGNDVYEDLEKNERKIFAVVFFTSTDMKDYFNFSYKDIHESCGPFAYDCPLSILKLLSPTNDEWALEWRRKCYEKHEKKKNSIGKLPIGTKIKFTRHDGVEIVLTKHSPGYQFKTPFWVNESNWTYYKKKHIPENFEVLEYGE